MTRGEGRGVGGTPQGLGPVLFCKCVKCGKKYPHMPGVPCNSQPSCLVCGGSLGPYE